MRLSSASCAPNWAQTFGYDAWGNINKSGSVSFSSQGGTGNRVPGFTYDVNGDVTNDTSHTYSYNLQGRPATVSSGVTAVYDAFTRLVEVQGSSNTQVVYAPDGYKFAYMQGQTLQKYLAPLGAGTTAMYTATGVAPQYILHADWLGSSRLGYNSSNSGSGKLDGDQAYGPFGESYNVSGNSLNVFTGQTADMGIVAGSSPIYDFCCDNTVRRRDAGWYPIPRARVLWMSPTHRPGIDMPM
jgi:hypothetical protein